MRTSRLRSVIGTAVCGANMMTMIPAATAIETSARMRRPRAARARSRSSSASCAASVGATPDRLGRRPRADVVAGRLDGADERRPIRDVGPVADRRRLGRQVDGRLLDARRLAEEALDPVDARRAGHALDRQGQLAGRWRVHTPWEYSIGPTVRDSRYARTSRHPHHDPGPVGSVPPRRHGTRCRGRRLADHRAGVRRGPGETPRRRGRERARRPARRSAPDPPRRRRWPRSRACWRAGRPGAPSPSTWPTVRRGTGGSSRRSRRSRGARPRATARSPGRSGHRGRRGRSVAPWAGTRSAC